MFKKKVYFLKYSSIPKYLKYIYIFHIQPILWLSVNGLKRAEADKLLIRRKNLLVDIDIVSDMENLQGRTSPACVIHFFLKYVGECKINLLDLTYLPYIYQSIQEQTTMSSIYILKLLSSGPIQS